MLHKKEQLFDPCNIDYLMNSAQSDVADLFKQASAAKLPVVRTWLFNSGSDNVWFQKWDESSNSMTINDDDSTGLGRMDYVVQQAAKNNVKLIFAFTNNWEDYGYVHISFSGLYELTPWLSSIIAAWITIPRTWVANIMMTFTQMKILLTLIRPTSNMCSIARISLPVKLTR